MSRFTERGLDAEEKSYDELTQALQTRLNLLHEGYVALAPDVGMGGVSNPEARQADEGDHVSAAQTNANDNEPLPGSKRKQEM